MLISAQLRMHQAGLPAACPFVIGFREHHGSVIRQFSVAWQIPGDRIIRSRTRLILVNIVEFYVDAFCLQTFIRRRENFIDFLWLIKEFPEWTAGLHSRGTPTVRG